MKDSMLNHKYHRIILLIKIKIKGICKNLSLYKWVAEKTSKNYPAEVNSSPTIEQVAQINLLLMTAQVLVVNSW